MGGRGLAVAALFFRGDPAHEPERRIADRPADRVGRPSAAALPLLARARRLRGPFAAGAQRLRIQPGRRRGAAAAGSLLPAVFAGLHGRGAGGGPRGGLERRGAGIRAARRAGAGAAGAAVHGFPDRGLAGRPGRGGVSLPLDHVVHRLADGLRRGVSAAAVLRPRPRDPRPFARGRDAGGAGAVLRLRHGHAHVLFLGAGGAGVRGAGVPPRRARAARVAGRNPPAGPASAAVCRAGAGGRRRQPMDEPASGRFRHGRGPHPRRGLPVFAAGGRARFLRKPRHGQPRLFRRAAVRAAGNGPRPVGGEPVPPRGGGPAADPRNRAGRSAGAGSGGRRPAGAGRLRAVERAAHPRRAPAGAAIHDDPADGEDLLPAAGRAGAVAGRGVRRRFADDRSARAAPRGGGSARGAGGVDGRRRLRADDARLLPPAARERGLRRGRGGRQGQRGPPRARAGAAAVAGFVPLDQPVRIRRHAFARAARQRLCAGRARGLF